jgi:hypothetical protein
MMRKDEIFSLQRAHGGRAQPVAFFHVLRQAALEPDDHAFLIEHIDALETADLLRWRARSGEGDTSLVIQGLAKIALRDPARFRHEVLDAPKVAFQDAEWSELTGLLHGKIDADTWQRIEARGPRPAASELVPAHATSDEGSSLDLGAELFGSSDGGDLLGGASEGGAIGSLLGDLGDGGLDLDLDLGLDDDAASTTKGPLEFLPPEDSDWSPSVSRLQPSFRDAVLDKARKTPRGDERAVLLEWLEHQGTPRAALVSVAAGAFRDGREISASVLAYLAKRLGDPSAWEVEGVELLGALIERRAFAELSDLVTFTANEASASSPGGDGAAQPALIGAIQGAFARALLAAARGSVESSRPDRAAAALASLACLELHADTISALKELRGSVGEGADPHVRALLALNERRAQKASAQASSLEGVIASVHAFADASASASG